MRSAPASAVWSRREATRQWRMPWSSKSLRQATRTPCPAPACAEAELHFTEGHSRRPEADWLHRMEERRTGGGSATSRFLRAPIRSTASAAASHCAPGGRRCDRAGSRPRVDSRRMPSSKKKRRSRRRPRRRMARPSGASMHAVSAPRAGHCPRRRDRRERPASRRRTRRVRPNQAARLPNADISSQAREPPSLR